MSDNIFHEAISEPPHVARTHDVTDHPPFFQAAIEQQKRQQQAARMTRQQMFDNGFLRVEDLDDEELRYGLCRDEHGRIPKRTNKTEMVPRDLYDEMVNEHAKRFDERLRQQLDVALNTMAEVMVDPSAEPKDKMEAAKWFVDRVRGKSVERVAVHVQKQPWEELLGDVAHVTRAQHEARKMGIIDAEVVEDVVPEGVSEVHEASEVEAEPDPVDWVGEYGAMTGPHAPAEPTPSHDSLATSSPTAPPTLSDHLRAAQDEAVRVAEARATRRKLVEDAKKRRRAMRATGGDVLRTNIDAEAFGATQDRFGAAVEETQTLPQRDTPPTG